MGEISRAKAEFLMIPGPVSIASEVLDSLGQEVLAHYGEGWTELYLRTAANLRQIFRTESEVHLVFGPGMAGVEMAIASVLGPGDKILIPSNGLFGERMAQVARANHLEVVELEAVPRAAVSAEAVRAALALHPDLRAIGIVHHETSIGVLNPIREIASLAREKNVLSIVDAVSSAGGADLDVDGWGIDICVTVGNKCLAGPIGVAPIVAGPRALAALDDGRPKSAGWYLNLATWRHFTDLWRNWHPHPTTMPTNVIRALDLAVQRVLEIGLEAHLLKQRTARDTVRGALREMGFEMLVPDEVASPVTTAVLGLPGMDVHDYMRFLLEEHGIRIGGGFGDFAGKAFRIGHMGRAMEPEAIQRYLSLTETYLERRS